MRSPRLGCGVRQDRSLRPQELCLFEHGLLLVPDESLRVHSYPSRFPRDVLILVRCNRPKIYSSRNL